MLIDLAAGTLLSLLVAYIFDVDITLLWVLFGALGAVLPDIDFFVEYLRRGTVGGKKLGAHRVLTHLPLLFLLPTIILLFWLGPAWAVLFGAGILWHFGHDAHAMGYGYRLFWPFSQKFYKFFSDKEGNYCYNREHVLVSWTKEEVEALHQKYGNDSWIEDHLRYHANNWLRPILSLLLLAGILLILTFFSLFFFV
jgi:hypothetical protein